MTIITGLQAELIVRARVTLCLFERGPRNAEKVPGDGFFRLAGTARFSPFG